MDPSEIKVLRRILSLYGYKMSQPRNGGLYRVWDARTLEVVFGGEDGKPTKTLEDIDAWITEKQEETCAGDVPIKTYGDDLGDFIPKPMSRRSNYIKSTR